MKKLAALLLVSAMTVVSLAGCGSTAEAPAAEAPAAEAETEEAAPAAEAETEEAAPAADAAASAEITTVTPGKLTVATSPDFAPYEFYSIDDSGTPTLAGFDMALAQYIADYLGGQSFVTVESKKDVMTSMDVANDAQYTIGAQTGSIQLDLANENTPNATIVSMPKVTDIVSELIAGKEDGAFIETDVAKCYQKNYPELYIVCDVPYDQVGSAIGVSKGNQALLDGVNEAIQAALADGSMSNFVAEANETATGEKYEGLLDDNGSIPSAE